MKLNLSLNPSDVNNYEKSNLDFSDMCFLDNTESFNKVKKSTKEKVSSLVNPDSFKQFLPDESFFLTDTNKPYNKCGLSCDILNNNCRSDTCANFYTEADKAIGGLLDQNSDETYNELSKIFNLLSGGKLSIDFYKPVSDIKDDLINYFDNFFKGEKINIRILTQSYEAINRFFSINHGNAIESNELYEIMSVLSVKLDLFLGYNCNPDIDGLYPVIDEGKYHDYDVEKLKNISGKFKINHSHLRDIDYSSVEKAEEGFLSIMQNQLNGMSIIKETKFGGHPENMSTPNRVFLVNHIHTYGLYLDFINKNGLTDKISDCNSEYFNFNKGLSVSGKKDKLLVFLINIFNGGDLEELSNKSNDTELKKGDFDKGSVIDGILSSFIENNSLDGYGTVISLEVIYHIFTLFPEDINTSPLILSFAEKMLLNDHDVSHAYNIMKLRVLRAIFKRIDAFNCYLNNDDCDPYKIYDFINKAEGNMKEFGSNFVFIYARTMLVMSRIYAGFYKNLSKNAEGEDQDFNFNTDDLESNIFSSFSFYDKLYGKSRIKDVRDNYDSLKKSIIEDFFHELKGAKYESLDKLFFKSKKSFYNIEGFNVKESIGAILKNNNVEEEFTSGFKNINKTLDSAAVTFFKDICSIKMIKKDDLNNETKFHNYNIDLGLGCVLSFDVDKKFESLFYEIMDNEKVLIVKIKDVLSDFVASYGDIYLDKITNLKNKTSFDGDIDDIEKIDGFGTLVTVDVGLFNYKGGTKRDQDIRKEFFIKKHAEMFNGVDLGVPYSFYHTEDGRFVYLFDGIKDEKGLKEKLENYIRSIKDRDTLSTSVSSFEGLLDKNSLNKCTENGLSLKPVDIVAESVIEDVIENRPEDILVYLQPIVQANGQPDKYECLTRIRIDPGKSINPGNMLFADDIFDVLGTRDKLYYEFTTRQIERAYSIIKDKGVDLSINLSIKDLFEYGDELILFLEGLNNESKKDFSGNITFELLENEMLPKEVKVVKSVMNKLKVMGYKIAIDDFGAGESNAVRLINMRNDIDIVKLDKNFVLSLRDDIDVYNKFLKEMRGQWLDDFTVKLQNNAIDDLKESGDVDEYSRVNNIYKEIVSDFNSDDLSAYLSENGFSLIQKLSSYGDEIIDKTIVESLDEWKKGFTDYISFKKGVGEPEMVKFTEKVHGILGQINGAKTKKGSKVICEYIEDQDVADFFTLMGVDLLQGYHFSKPVFFEEVGDEKVV